MAGKKGMHGNKLRCIHQDEIKKKIRAALIVKRLEDHILKDSEMTTSQVSAAGKLLDKIISNAPTDLNVGGQEDNPVSIISAVPISAADWQKKHGDQD